MDVIDQIVRVARDKQDQPLTPIPLRVEIKSLSKKEVAALLAPGTHD
jgi:hypothetical protein